VGVTPTPATILRLESKQREISGEGCPP
jgi:hypothetical protein